jgi:gas vesicle protein
MEVTMRKRSVPAAPVSSSGQGKFFIFGLLCGAALGAAAGLVFAPKAGSELRDDIEESVDQLKQRVADASRDVIDVVNEFAETGREAFQEAREGVSHVPRTASRAARAHA